MLPTRTSSMVLQGNMALVDGAPETPSQPHQNKSNPSNEPVGSSTYAGAQSNKGKEVITRKAFENNKKQKAASQRKQLERTASNMSVRLGVGTYIPRRFTVPTFQYGEASISEVISKAKEDFRGPRPSLSRSASILEPSNQLEESLQFEESLRYSDVSISDAVNSLRGPGTALSSSAKLADELEALDDFESLLDHPEAPIPQVQLRGARTLSASARLIDDADDITSSYNMNRLLTEWRGSSVLTRTNSVLDDPRPHPHVEIANKLKTLQKDLRKWEEDHPLDLDKIAQAMKLTVQGHEEKLGLGERNSKYSEAEELMLQGLGIDKETWKRARHQIGMQGLVDVYDSAATVLVLGPLLSLAGGVGAEALGPVLGHVIKYAAMWTATAFSNGAGQIMVDGFQDTVARHDGVPTTAPDVNNARHYWKLARTGIKKMREAEKLHKELKDPATDPARRDEIRRSLGTLLDDMDELHLNYRQRTSRGQQNFVKYGTQVGYKVVTTPGVIGAGIALAPIMGPFGFWLAAAVQQAGQAPFGYLDEILLKRHIVRSNAKYADLLTDEAKERGVTRASEELSASDIDPVKAKRLWSHPVDVMRDNVTMVYTDELATLLRKERKLEKQFSEFLTSAHKKGQSTYVDLGDLDKLSKKVVRGKGKKSEIQAPLIQVRKDIKTLKQDIVTFQKGVNAIKNGGDEMEHWGRLSPEGTIAKMLTDGIQHFLLLTRAKFRRPGEYMAQVLDRHGGLALPRTAGLAFVDGFEIGHHEQQEHHIGEHGHNITPEGQYKAPVLEVGPDLESSTTPLLAEHHQNPAAEWIHEHAGDIESAAVTQAGVLAGNSIYNPITKFTKQLEVRALGLPKYDRLLESGQVQRKQIFGEKRVVYSGIVELEGGITVDLRNTRAYYKETRSLAYQVGEGTRDFAKGFGKHMKAAATLPVRYAAAATTDRKLKKSIEATKRILERSETM